MLTSSQHVYEVCPRHDTRGVDLISDVLPFCRQWYREPACAMITKLCWTLSASLLVFVITPVQGRESHREESLGWSSGPVSNSALDASLREAAVRYRANAPVPRYAFFDIACPRDSVEAAALNGYAILVVTALVQDKSEIPLRRIYFRSSNGDQQVRLHAAVASRITDSSIRATFGAFRYDAAYLLPLALRVMAGDLLLDFAAHRQEFRLARFTGDIPDPIRRLGPLSPPRGRPSKAAINNLIRREYPDLAKTLPLAP